MDTECLSGQLEAHIGTAEVRQNIILSQTAWSGFSPLFGFGASEQSLIKNER